jgi:hypothetical protein
MAIKDTRTGIDGRRFWSTVMNVLLEAVLARANR